MELFHQFYTYSAISNSEKQDGNDKSIHWRWTEQGPVPAFKGNQYVVGTGSKVNGPVFFAQDTVLLLNKTHSLGFGKTMGFLC